MIGISHRRGPLGYFQPQGTVELFVDQVSKTSAFGTQKSLTDRLLLVQLELRCVTRTLRSAVMIASKKS